MMLLQATSDVIVDIYGNDSTCGKEIKNCEDCELWASIECTKCITGYYLRSPVICAPCSLHEACLECTHLNDFDHYYFVECTKCQDGYYIDVVNKDGQYKICTKCPQNFCAKCSGPVECEVCSAGHYLDKKVSPAECKLCASLPHCMDCDHDGNCTKCTSDDYINKDGKCELCSAAILGCSVCQVAENDVICMKCQSDLNDYMLFDNTCTPCHLTQCKKCDQESQRCLDCAEGQYLNENGRCELCSAAAEIPNCIKCSILTVSNNDQLWCQQCGGEFLAIDGKCEPCGKMDGCLRCRDGECERCDEPTYFLLNGQCSKCDSGTDQQCLECQFATTMRCGKCQENWFLLNGKCVEMATVQPHCVAGYTDWDQADWTTSSNYCTECTNGRVAFEGECKECNDPKIGINDCQSCSAEGNVYRCTTCKVGFYRTSQGQCKPCDTIPGCQVCSTSSEQCISCVPDTFFMRGTNCISCKEDQPYCIHCANDGTECSVCDTGFYPLDKKCVSCSTIPGCIGSCDNSNPDGYCLGRCEDGLFLRDGQCHKCSEIHDACTSCTFSNEVPVCTACNDGYYNDDTTCVKCGTLCAKCSSIECLLCEIGNYEIDGKDCKVASNCTMTNVAIRECVLCDNGYFLNAGFCVPCADIDPANLGTCLTCSRTEKKCLKSAVTNCIYAGGVECLPCNSTSFANSQECKSCIEAEGQFQCVECSSDSYTVVDGACVKCNAVNPGCSTCTGNGETFKCTACINSEYYCDAETGTCTLCSFLHDACTRCGVGCLSCIEGYYAHEKTCILCTELPFCATCDNDGSCLSCLENAYLVTGVKNTCTPCLNRDATQACLVCNDDSTCLRCKSGYAVKFDGSCGLCDSGDGCVECAFDGIADDKVCSVCQLGNYISAVDNQCYPCTTLSGGKCTMCDNVTGDCTACNGDGVFLQHGGCVACADDLSNCSDCVDKGTGLRHCILCKSNLYFPRNGQCVPAQELDNCVTADPAVEGGKCTECGELYLVDSGACVLCAEKFSQCETCSQSECKSCHEGFVLIPGAVPICLECSLAIEGCVECNEDGQCVACVDNTYYRSNFKCYECKDSLPDCSLCESDSVCLECDEGFFLDTSSKTCKPCGTAPVTLCSECSTVEPKCLVCSPGNILIDNLCQRCEDDCATCVSKNNQHYCTACKDDLNVFLHEGQCVDCTDIGHCLECENIEGQKCTLCNSNFVVYEGRCEACDAHLPGCTTCSGTTAAAVQCTACVAGKYLSADKMRCVDCTAITGCKQGACNNTVDGGVQCNSCITGMYIDERVCSPCTKLPHCMECTASDDCTKCKTGYFPSDGECIECSLGDSSCVSCLGIAGETTALYCTQCSNGKFASDGQCVSCSQSITNCQQCNNKGDTCSLCSEGFFPRNGEACVPCTVLDQCKTCREGSAGGFCLECEDGYYPSGGVCVPCTDMGGCSKCTNNTLHGVCEECDAGYYLTSTTCVPCDRSSLQCIECTFTGQVFTCTACAMGYVLNDGVCSGAVNMMILGFLVLLAFLF